MTAPVPEPDEGDDGGEDEIDPDEGGPDEGDAEPDEVDAFAAVAADGDQETGDPVQPAGNASREAWADYALSQGADPAEVEGMTRNSLRDVYGG